MRQFSIELIYIYNENRKKPIQRPWNIKQSPNRRIKSTMGETPDK